MLTVHFSISNCLPFVCITAYQSSDNLFGTAFENSTSSASSTVAVINFNLCLMAFTVSKTGLSVQHIRIQLFSFVSFEH